MTSADFPTSGIDREKHLLNQLKKRPVRTDLEPMREAIAPLNHLNEPAVVQIVGSKGKGSVAHFLSELLVKSGHSVMSFTSPHFNHPCERFSNNGQTWDKERFRDELETVDDELFNQLSPFELLLYLFLRAVEANPPQFVLIEAGMGGRWDASSALPADLTVLTSIEQEHSRFLGDTEAEITREKTAQVPEGTILVSGPVSSDARKVIRDRVTEKRLIYSECPAGEDALGTMKDMAVLAASFLTGESEEQFQELAADTARPEGRQEEQTVKGRRVIFDVAHTPGSIRALVERVEREVETPSTLVLGLLEGKRANEITDILQESIPVDRWFLVKPPSPRAMAPESIRELVTNGAQIPCFSRIEECAGQLQEQTERGDSIVITGSFPLVSWFQDHGFSP